jgi:hypothetical protein
VTSFRPWNPKQGYFGKVSIDILSPPYQSMNDIKTLGEHLHSNAWSIALVTFQCAETAEGQMAIPWLGHIKKNWCLKNGPDPIFLKIFI